MECIQNLTVFLGRLAKNRTQFLAILVQRHHGHRHRIFTSCRNTVQSRLAVLARSRIPRSQRRTLHLRFLRLCLQIYRLPRDLDCHDRRQRQFALSWDDTDGVRHAHFCLVYAVYSVLGFVGSHVCLGVLDD